jgi:membrane-associated phospholipid phosphatase
LRRLGVLLILCAAGPAAVAQTPNARPLVSWPEAIGAVALTGITFLTDRDIRSTFQGHDTRFRSSVADVGNMFGNVRYVYPLLLVGAVGSDAAGWSGFHRVSWRAFKSAVLGGGTTFVLKSLIGRRRPDVSPDDPYQFSPLSFRFNSFPSGHVTAAFALATSLSMETRSVLPDIVLYGLAASTAFGRMHVDKHWASDTVVAAGIGILAARYVRRHDRSGDAGTLGFAGSFTF